MDERRRLMMGQGDSGSALQNATPVSNLDLSMVDNAGNARTSRTTANCYLVHAPGTYKIPLVYGNAIKNGAVNTEAFNPTGTSGTYFLKPFINHAGTGINAPNIDASPDRINILTRGMGISITDAELLWQDVNGMITSVSYESGSGYVGYLNFTVSQENIAPGNAVLAVKSSNTIVWSWHIWVTEEDLSNTTVVTTGSHNYTVAPINLGWVPTEGDGKQGYCPYYQWGRKDPFIPCNGTTNGNTNKTVYNISGATVTGIQYESSTSATIATNIQNPIKHYFNSSKNGPCNTTYYNMWDAQNTTTNNVTTATKKTIYDPCPPGFCVPTGNLWYYFGNGGNRTMSTYETTNKGATWNTGITGDALWFPAAGYRNRKDSSLNLVGGDGLYWSATPQSTNSGHYLDFDAYKWYWTNNGRAFSIPVRPVAEE